MSHCINCGIEHREDTWPKSCVGNIYSDGCGHIMFNNPIPIVTMLQPVIREGRAGLAIAQRSDNEGWALFAGHVDPGETLEQGAVREFREETGIPHWPSALSYVKSQFTPHQVMAVFSLPPIPFGRWEQAVLCPENLAFDVLWSRDDRQMIFPLHRELVCDWFDNLK